MLGKLEAGKLAVGGRQLARRELVARAGCKLATVARVLQRLEVA